MPAKRTVTRRPATVDTERAQAREEAVERLTDLGLTSESVIRFRKPGARKWTEGKPSHVNPDGSIVVYVEKWRTLDPETIERRDRGPRGGVAWVPLVDA